MLEQLLHYHDRQKLKAKAKQFKWTRTNITLPSVSKDQDGKNNGFEAVMQLITTC